MTFQRSTIHLLDLPADIHNLIVNQLIRSDPLFPPLFPEGEGYGDLKRKSREHYSYPAPEEESCAEGLLNWSSTCRYFRQLIAPGLFKTLVLRTKPKSIHSIQALSKTRYWSGVQSFIFVGTFHQDEDGTDDWEGDTDSQIEANEEQALTKRIETEMNELSSILSNLPPSLTSLTLDFPQDWEDEYDYATLNTTNNNTGGDNDYFFNDAGLSKAEKTDRYRAQLHTVFTAVCKNDISDKPSFELRLHNIPPFRCSAWGTPDVSLFLKHVTAFTFSLCHYDNGAGWNMNTMEMPFKFAEKLGTWFFDHLEKVCTFNFHADDSWPFGLAPGMNHVSLRLPTASPRMPAISHVSFRQVFVCDELIKFLTLHSKTLVSLNLIDCFAGGENGLSEVQEPPHWAKLFSALVTAAPPNLTHINVSNPGKKLKELVQDFEDENGDAEEKYNTLNDILTKQWEERVKAYRNGADSADVERRMRRVLSHCILDDKYGMVFDDGGTNVGRFLGGEDHEAYMKLVKIIEENVAREIGHSGTE